MTTLIVLAARPGDPVAASRLLVPDADRVIAVDSGLHLATSLGLTVDLLVGDMDSVHPAAMARARAARVEFDVHPRDKDHTDLALALHRAADDGADRIVVIGGAGGRLDHGLANLLVLADAALAHIEVTAHLGGAKIAVVRDRVFQLDAADGTIVSLIPVGADAVVTTSGLRWDLNRSTLGATDSRGVSNELAGPGATVFANAGVVLAIQPAPEEASEPTP